MQPPDDAGTSPVASSSPTDEATSALTPRSAREQGRLRTLLEAAWRYAPSYEAQFSWEGLYAALVRSVCCGVLLFGMLASHRPLPHTDLYPGYVAATLANEGQWDHIYHRSVWLHQLQDPAWDKRAVEITGGLAGTSFVYHPWYLQILRPIAKVVPWRIFQRDWVVMNRVCIVVIGLGLALLMGLETFQAQALITLTFGIAGTTTDGIDLGQNVLPALMFALGAILSWRSRTPLWLGGLCAALAWTCKPWCATLLLLCFLLRGVRAGLYTTLGVGFVMGVLPGLVMPAVLMQHYREMTIAITRVSVFGFNNLSILGTLERFTYPDWSKRVYEWMPRDADLKLRLLALAIAGAVFVASAVMWWRRRPQQRYTIAAYLAFMLLPLGICWTHYFVFALPLAMLCTFRDDSPFALRVLGISLLAILLGLMVQVGISQYAFQLYQTQPLRFPWRHATPIALVIANILGCMALAPREAREARR